MLNTLPAAAPLFPRTRIAAWSCSYLERRFLSQIIVSRPLPRKFCCFFADFPASSSRVRFPNFIDDFMPPGLHSASLLKSGWLVPHQVTSADLEFSRSILIQPCFVPLQPQSLLFKTELSFFSQSPQWLLKSLKPEDRRPGLIIESPSVWALL